MQEIIQVPQQFLCPICQKLMSDPVIASDGVTYERKCIQLWYLKIKQGSDKSFLPIQRFPHYNLIPNVALQNTINHFNMKMKNKMKYELKITNSEIFKTKNDLQHSQIISECLQTKKQNNKLMQRLEELQAQRDQYKKMIQQRNIRSSNQNSNFKRLIAVSQSRQSIKRQLSYKQLQQKEDSIIYQKDQTSIQCSKFYNMLFGNNQQKQDQKNKEKLIYQLKTFSILKKNGIVFLTPNISLPGFQSNYQLDSQNNKVCISKEFKGSNYSNVISKEALPKESSFVFKIKVHKVEDKKMIVIGIIPQQYIQQKKNLLKNNLSFSIAAKLLYKNRQKFQVKKAEDYLKQTPSQICVQVDMEEMKIVWKYNGKDQASSAIPKEWNQTKLYAEIILLSPKRGDVIEFI